MSERAQRESPLAAGRWCLHCEDAIPESALKCPSCGEVTEAGKLKAFPQMLEALRWSNAMLHALYEHVRDEAMRSFDAGLKANAAAIAAATGGEQ